MRTEQTGANRTKKRTRLLFWYELLFLVIIFVGVFWGRDVLRLLMKSGFSGLEVKETAMISLNSPETPADPVGGTEGRPNSTEMGRQDNRQIFIMDNTLLVRRAQTLTAYDVEGDKLSERQLGGTNTKILEYGDKYLLYEADLGILALVGSDNKVIKELRLQKAIEDVKVSKERIFVKPGQKNSVIFLDNELNEQGSVEIKNRELIFMESNYESSELLCYNTEILANSLSSSVIVYNKHQKVIASLDLNGALLLDMHAGSSIFLLTDKAIMNYSKSLSPLYEKPYEGEISLSQMDRNKLYFLLDKSMRAGGKEFVVYGSEGEEAFLTLMSNIEHIKPGKKYILLASMDKISILDYNIKVLDEQNFIEDIEEIDWIDEEHFYIKSASRVRIYSIN